MTAAIELFAAQTETGRDLPGEPWMLGLGSFVLLVLMLVITLSFGKDR
jgi:hypothetical protein